MKLENKNLLNNILYDALMKMDAYISYTRTELILTDNKNIWIRVNISSTNIHLIKSPNLQSYQKLISGGLYKTLVFLVLKIKE